MNLIELPVSEWKNALTGLGKVLPRFSPLPALQCIRVTRDSEGTVTLRATDRESHVCYRAEQSQPGTPLDVLVPYQPLNKLVKVTKDKLGILAEGKQQVKLRYHIGGNPVEQPVDNVPFKDWPEPPKVEAAPITVNGDFHRALNQAFECCSTDDTRHLLQGAFLDVSDPKGHYIVGTNGWVLFSANSFALDLKTPVIIPHRKFLTWPALGEGEGQLAVQPPVKAQDVGWIRFDYARWSFITKEITGNFPNWKQVLPTKESSTTTVSLKPEAIDALLAAIDRLPCHAPDLGTIQLLVKPPDGLIIQGRNKDDREWTNLAVDGASIEGRPITIALNRDYLAKALRFGLSTFRLWDELTPLDFHKGGQRMIIMPIRTEVSPSTAATPAAQPPTPPPVTAEAPKKETETMTAITTPPRGNLNGATKTEDNGSALFNALTKLEATKTKIRDVLNDLTEVAVMLKAAEKEKRTTHKEVEQVRSTLRSLQRVEI